MTSYSRFAVTTALFRLVFDILMTHVLSIKNVLSTSGQADRLVRLCAIWGFPLMFYSEKYSIHNPGSGAAELKSSRGSVLLIQCFKCLFFV